MATDTAQVADGLVDALHTDSAETRQFVTFVTGGEVFAVDMAPVQEIIRIPEVVRVPLAPPALNGLANLRGKVVMVEFWTYG